MDKYTLLTREVPPISGELKKILSLKSLCVKTVGIFDPKKAVNAIAREEGKLVTAFDIGGQKIARQVFQIESGKLMPVTGIDTQRGVGGDTYLAFLQVSRRTPFVGVSCAGFLDGTILADSPNAQTFARQLGEEFGGDFKLLFKTSQVSLDNDAVAGVKAAGMELCNRNPNVRSILFVVNGEGFGFAICGFIIFWISGIITN